MSPQEKLFRAIAAAIHAQQPPSDCKCPHQLGVTITTSQVGNGPMVLVACPALARLKDTDNPEGCGHLFRHARGCPFVREDMTADAESFPKPENDPTPFQSASA
jgi:hypothetical protein